MRFKLRIKTFYPLNFPKVLTIRSVILTAISPPCCSGSLSLSRFRLVPAAHTAASFIAALSVWRGSVFPLNDAAHFDVSDQETQIICYHSDESAGSNLLPRCTPQVRARHFYTQVPLTNTIFCFNNNNSNNTLKSINISLITACD